MRRDQISKLKVKNIIKSFLDESVTPVELRIQLAKGLIPLETRELVTAFFFSLFDSSHEVKAAAKDSIDKLPERMLYTYLSYDVPAQVLHYFALSKMSDEKCLELIVLNKGCSTTTLKKLAEVVSEKIALMIADNQQKILEDPEIVDALAKNSNVHVSLIEKLKSFLAGFAKEAEEVPAKEVQAPVEAPEEAKLEPVEEEPEDYTKSAIEAPPDEEIEQYSAEEIEEMRLNTYQRIQKMSVAEKIQEALKGNKEARGILIKDSNKLVSSAVIKSPKITEEEVVKVTASRSISDEVLRLVCQKEEWLRNYQVKLNLVNNPKTPFKTALKFMNFLHKKDLETLAKSKNVPSLVSTTARKIAAKRRS